MAKFYDNLQKYSSGRASALNRRSCEARGKDVCPPPPCLNRQKFTYDVIDRYDGSM